jgi:choline dehydrogenase-like flavoprotein
MRATNTAVYLAVAPAEDTGIAALSRLIAAVPRGEMPEDLSSEIGRILGDLDGTARHAWRRWVRGESRSAPIDKLRLSCLGEQVPNPASRVTLSDERDPLGIPRAQLDWRLSELDREGVAKLARTVGTELGRLGAGRLRLRDWTLETGGWPEDLQGGHHHMGTTRMADDPKAGVVDRNCRVHGIDNLYVAGSSVFPTAGYANPTLTILALTLRLADHLRDRARAERSPQLG